jgi:hypothetical protein
MWAPQPRGRLLALEDLTQDGDGLRRQLRQVGQGACLDFAVLAIALTKKDRRQLLPFRHHLTRHRTVWSLRDEAVLGVHTADAGLVGTDFLLAV